MADDNLFQQYLRPPKSVMEYTAEYDAADARKQALRQNALELAAGQQKQDDYTRERGADNALSRLVSSGQTPDQVAVGLAQAGYGKHALAYTKQQQDLANAKATNEHLSAQTGKLTVETGDLAYKQREEKRQKSIQDIAAFTDPQQALASLALHEQAGDIAPEQAALVRQTIPQNPADFPKWQVGMLQRIMSAKDAAGQIAPDANNVATNARIKSEGDANRDNQIKVQKIITDRQTATVETPESIEKMAQGIASGRLAPMSSFAMLKPSGKAIMSRVLDINPSYDAGDYLSKNKALRDFGTGTQGLAVQAANTGLNHLDTIEELAKAQKNRDVRMFNAAANRLAAELGSAAPTSLAAAITMVAPEVSKMVIGAAGGQEERKTFAHNFDPNGSPEQTIQGLAAIRHLLGGRLTEAERTYQRTTGRKDFGDAMLSPAAKKVLSSATSAPHATPAKPALPAGWKVEVY